MRLVGVVTFVLLSGSVVGAEDHCRGVPPGPERTDCYLALSRFYREQGDLAAAEAQAKADAAWYRAITGIDPPPARRLPDRSRRR